MTTRKKYTFLAIAACLLTAATALLAQDAPAPASTEAPRKVEEMTLADMIRVGGWTMWPLGFCSAAAIGLSIFNGLTVRSKKLLNPEAVNEISVALSHLDIETAKQKCAAAPCMITNVIAAGLSRIRGEIHLTSVEKAMEESSLEEIGTVLVPINYISAAAVVAPMLGLLGTVSGMITAFRNMAMGGMGRPEMLAENIQEALITTATGLIIGIPAMVAYLYFKNKFTSIISSMNRVAGNVMEVLTVATREAQAAAYTSPAHEAHPEVYGEHHAETPHQS